MQNLNRVNSGSEIIAKKCISDNLVMSPRDTILSFRDIEDLAIRGTWEIAHEIISTPDAACKQNERKIFDHRRRHFSGVGQRAG